MGSKMRVFRGITLLALIIGAFTSANASTGVQILDRCQKAVKVMEGSQNDVTPVMVGEANYCMGSIEATISMLALHRDLAPKDRAVCIPKISLYQGARVAVKFLEGRPDLLHLNSGSLLYLAFREAYPCESAEQNAD